MHSSEVEALHRHQPGFVGDVLGVQPARSIGKAQGQGLGGKKGVR